MKKYIMIVALLLFSIFLVACRDEDPIPSTIPTDPTVIPTDPTVVPTDPTIIPTDPTVIPTEPIDIAIDILEEVVINNQIHVSFAISHETLDASEVEHLMHDIANQIYLYYFNLIDGRLFYLNLYGFANENQFANEENPSFGWFVYGINLSVDQPGLRFVRSE